MPLSSVPSIPVGSDLLSVLVYSPSIRRLYLPPHYYLSAVDLMEMFAPEGNIPRVYWNQQKRRLLAKDEELYQSLIQLKLPSPDGKLRQTDLVPDWAAIFLILLMDTPKATEFKKAFAKGASVAMSAGMLKHRAQNIASGLEWSADSINLLMPPIDPDDNLPERITR